METIQIIIALLNVPIAGLLAFVAWQNYKISQAGFYIQKDKLRLELFDRRLKIFEAYRSLFLSFPNTGKINRERLLEFTTSNMESEFLFGKEIIDYYDLVMDNCVRLMKIEVRLEQGNKNTDERAKLANEAESLEKWFEKQIDEVSQRFRKYLHFSIDKDPY